MSIVMAPEKRQAERERVENFRRVRKWKEFGMERESVCVRACM